MTFPLYVLAILAALGGFWGVPHLLGDFLGHMPHVLSGWLDPVVPSKHLPLVGIKIPLHEGLVMAGSSVLAILSFSAGIILFKKHMFVTDLLAAFNPIEKILANKYYVDELYQIIIVTPVKKIASFSAAIIDKLVIDGAVNGIGSQVRRIGSGLRTLQTGDLQSYALMMLMGLLVVIFLIFKVLV